MRSVVGLVTSTGSVGMGWPALTVTGALADLTLPSSASVMIIVFLSKTSGSEIEPYITGTGDNGPNIGQKVLQTVLSVANNDGK